MCSCLMACRVPFALPVCMAALQIHSWQYGHEKSISRLWSSLPTLKIRELSGSNCFCDQIYIVLLKVDFYFIVGFILQYNLIDVHFDEPEYSLTMTLIPVTLIIMVAGIYCVRSERRVLMVCVSVSAKSRTHYISKFSLILYLSHRFAISELSPTSWAGSSFFLETAFERQRQPKTWCFCLHLPRCSSHSSLLRLWSDACSTLTEDWKMCSSQPMHRLGDPSCPCLYRNSRRPPLFIHRTLAIPV